MTALYIWIAFSIQITCDYS